MLLVGADVRRQLGREMTFAFGDLVQSERDVFEDPVLGLEHLLSSVERLRGRCIEAAKKFELVLEHLFHPG
jgi:hypothetical protein